VYTKRRLSSLYFISGRSTSRKTDANRGKEGAVHPQAEDGYNFTHSHRGTQYYDIRAQEKIIESAPVVKRGTENQIWGDSLRGNLLGLRGLH